MSDGELGPLEMLEEMCALANCAVEVEYRPSGRRWRYVAFVKHCWQKQGKPIYGETVEDVITKAHANIDWDKALVP